jgi:hypothetical protein
MKGEISSQFPPDYFISVGYEQISEIFGLTISGLCGCAIANPPCVGPCIGDVFLCAHVTRTRTRTHKQTHSAPQPLHFTALHSTIGRVTAFSVSLCPRAHCAPNQGASMLRGWGCYQRRLTNSHHLGDQFTARVVITTPSTLARQFAFSPVSFFVLSYSPADYRFPRMTMSKASFLFLFASASENSFCDLLHFPFFLFVFSPHLDCSAPQFALARWCRALLYALLPGDCFSCVSCVAVFIANFRYPQLNIAAQTFAHQNQMFAPGKQQFSKATHTVRRAAQHPAAQHKSFAPKNSSLKSYAHS